VLGDDVFAEFPLGFCARIKAASRACLLSSIEDDPDGSAVAACWPEMEAWAFAWSRHFFLIVAISSNVTKYFPAISS
jgi:hypothetical protein